MEHYVLDVFMGEDRMTAKESHNNFFLLNLANPSRLDALLRIA